MTLWLYGNDTQKLVSGLPGLHSHAFPHHQCYPILLRSDTQLHRHADAPGPPSKPPVLGSQPSLSCCPEPAVLNPANLLQRTPERADNLSKLHRKKIPVNMEGEPHQRESSLSRQAEKSPDPAQTADQQNLKQMLGYFTVTTVLVFCYTAKR